jgi:cell division protein FtsW
VRYVKRPMTIAPGMIDSRLAVMAVILSVWGVVMVFSASPEMSMKDIESHFQTAQRQFLFMIVGIAAMLTTAFIDYHKFESRKLLLTLFAITSVLLVATHYEPFGFTYRNASRWLVFKGVSLQPSEFAKASAVILIAAQIARRGEDRMRSFMNGVVPVFLISLAFSFLIWRQNDLGSVVIIMGATFFLLYIGGARIKHLGLTLLAMGAIGVAGICTSAKRIGRIETWINGESDIFGAGWQIYNSKIAFGSGHITGCGLIDGRQKLSYLPEIHKEFILANVGEEVGFVGVTITLAFFTLLVIKGFSIAKNAGDPFGRYIAFGASCVLGLGVIFNTYVVLALVPNKGIALPFLSYGGSSLVASFILVGLILSVSRWTEKDLGP